LRPFLADYPVALTDAVAAGGGEAKRAFEMTMKKTDLGTIKKARQG
jgi:hypothetical protein